MEELLYKKKLKGRRWIFKGIKLPNYRKRSALKTTILLHSTICIDQIYPSQVASQKCLCPFQFDKSKINYFCKLISGLKNDHKIISKLSINV
jgi:hypothetical protein